MAPTATGRTIAGLIGLGIGCTVTYFLTRDLQLVKFEPAVPNSDGTFAPKKVKVSFREMEPLELKKEVREQREKERERALQDELAVAQEPTS